MSWEENFNIFLDNLLKKPSNALITNEKADKIRNVLLNEKVETARFRQYVKQKKYAIVNCPIIGVEDELCIPAKEDHEKPGLFANWRRVITVENIFNTLKLVHEGARAHTGYHKLFKDVEDRYIGIPRKICVEFVKGCIQCACKKPQQNIAPLQPISSKHFMHRGQLDLVDKRADPDSSYCWIGHYIDHFTKFNFFWPQHQKTAHEVSENLKTHVFSVIGLPNILQHDNGREFCNEVIRETLKLWPGGNVKIITGRPRHPRTQGLVEQVHNSLHRLLASKRSEKPGSGWLEFLPEIQYSLNTQFHSSIKLTPFEAVFGQKANDGILVGSKDTDEFIDEEDIEDLFNDAHTDDSQTDDSQTDNSQASIDNDSQTDIDSNSQTDDFQPNNTQPDMDNDSQTDIDSNSQTDDSKTDNTQPDTDNNSQIDTSIDSYSKTEYPQTDNTQTDINDSQTKNSQIDVQTYINAEVHQPLKRRRTAMTERETAADDVEIDIYEVSDQRPTQAEYMAVEDFMVLNDLLVRQTDGRTETVDLKRTENPTTNDNLTPHEKIRKRVDENYKKSVINTMKKYNKKVSKSNEQIVKGSFVTLRIPVVDRASGDLPRLLCRVDDVRGHDLNLYKLSCEYGVIVSCYDIGDLELLKCKVDTSHWVQSEISLHAAAKQASFSLSCKRCKCKGPCLYKSCKCRKSMVPCGSKCLPGRVCQNILNVDS